MDYRKRQQEQAQSEQAQQQIKGLIGQKGQQFEQAGPMQPGVERQQLQGQGTGLIGGQIAPSEFYARAMAIPGYEQIGATGLQTTLKDSGAGIADKYSNVTQDDLGNWWGLNKASGQAVQIPMASQDFTRLKTVQGATPQGLPLTQLYNPRTQQAIDVAQRTPLPSEPEAKGIAGAEYADVQLQTLQNLATGPDAPSIGPMPEVMRDIKQTPIIGDILQSIGMGMSTGDARLTSLTSSLSNQVLAAMRGAQVGPAEQEKFEKQLPMPGQPRSLFLENLKATRENLAYMNKRKSELRGINQPTSLIGGNNPRVAPPPPPGFE
jgi:hypothetical protein